MRTTRPSPPAWRLPCVLAFACACGGPSGAGSGSDQQQAATDEAAETATEATPAPGAPAAAPIPSKLGFTLDDAQKARQAEFIAAATKPEYACINATQADQKTDLPMLFDMAARGEDPRVICYGLKGLLRPLRGGPDEVAAQRKKHYPDFLHVVDRALSHEDDRIAGVGAQLAYRVLRTHEGFPPPHPEIFRKLAALVSSERAVGARTAAVEASRDAYGLSAMPEHGQLYARALESEEQVVYGLFHSRTGVTRHPGTDAERKLRPRVEAFLSDERPHIRAVAVAEYGRLLGEDEWPGELERFFRLMDDPEAIVRAQAVLAVGGHLDVKQLPRLAAKLEDSGEPRAPTKRYKSPWGADAVTTFGGPRRVCKGALEAIDATLENRTGALLRNVAFQYGTLRPDRTLDRQASEQVRKSLELDPPIGRAYNVRKPEACAALHQQIEAWLKTAMPHLLKLEEAWQEKQKKKSQGQAP